MEEQDTNSPVALDPSSEGSFSEEVLNQLKTFVAQRMFQGVSFTQVLTTIDRQCAHQASQSIDNASPEDLQAIHSDMQEDLAQAYAEQQAYDQAQAATDEVIASDEEECCEDPGDCEKPEDCQK